MKLTALSFAAVLGLSTVAAAIPAFAQQAGAPQQAADANRPAPTPVATDGHIARFIVGPMGRTRGFVLDNGAIIMIHGRADANAQAAQLAVGTAVHVEGFTFAGSTSPIVRATVSVNGQVILAPPAFRSNGQGHAAWQGMSPADRMARFGARRQEMEARMAQLPVLTTAGTVETVLAGRGGTAHGALLSTGASVFFPHEIAQAIRTRGGLRAGEALQVSGHGRAYPHGTALMATQITFADGSSVTAQ